MSVADIKYCPGTLAEGYDTYSFKCGEAYIKV